MRKKGSASCLFPPPRFTLCVCVRAGGPPVDSSPLLRTISFCLWPQSMLRGLHCSAAPPAGCSERSRASATTDLAMLIPHTAPAVAPANLSFRLSEQQLWLSWERLEQQQMQGNLLAYRVQWSLGGETQVRLQVTLVRLV